MFFVVANVEVAVAQGTAVAIDHIHNLFLLK